MQLYLVQHGEAVASEVDPDRPLSASGQTDVKTMAAFLSRANINPSSILHSGKTRARQTAEIFADSLGQAVQVIPVSGINPNDPVEDFINQIDDASGNVMIVGHLPFMAKLVTLLVSDKTDPVITSFQPGSVVCLTRDNDTGWQVAWMLRPDLFNN